MSADAIILPACENFRMAMLDASRAVRPPNAKLYTNGHRLAWLPRPLPGWYRIGAADVRDAYEDCDALAGCCDVGRVA